jgi:hypothetical protein
VVGIGWGAAAVDGELPRPSARNDEAPRHFRLPVNLTAKSPLPAVNFTLKLYLPFDFVLVTWSSLNCVAPLGSQ